LTPTSYRKGAFNQEIKQKEFLKRGYTYLKPTVVEFLRCIHIQSEKQQSSSGSVSSEMAQSQRELSIFFESETSKLSKLTPGSFDQLYVNYFFDSLLNLIICYYNKFLEVSRKTRVMGDEEERRDDKALKNLTDNLKKKLELFDGMLTKKQLQRVVKLINYY
jgi:hypothetical protein